MRSDQSYTPHKILNLDSGRHVHSNKLLPVPTCGFAYARRLAHASSALEKLRRACVGGLQHLHDARGDMSQADIGTHLVEVGDCGLGHYQTFLSVLHCRGTSSSLL